MIEKVLKNVCIKVEDVSYVEIYGIGILLGDFVEIRVLVEIFSKGWIYFLIIGLVKFNIGYFEAVVGVINLIKVVLCL